MASKPKIPSIAETNAKLSAPFVFGEAAATEKPARVKEQIDVVDTGSEDTNMPTEEPAAEQPEPEEAVSATTDA